MDKTRLTQLFFALQFVIFTASWVGIDASRVTITKNGYNNLVVAISPQTPVNQSEIIIQNIQKMFLEASPVLYVATKNRAFFESVHILIPESWDHIKANFSTWETFNTADVIVDTPNPMHEDVPYTQQNGKCGEKGERIHLTPNYVATLFEAQKVLQYGKPGKVFVHEWAHYRYGVFDEYGKPGGEYPLFYQKSSSSLIEPNICSNQTIESKDFSIFDITDNSTTCKINPVTKIYDQNCRFKFNSTLFKPSTSLASYHLLDSVIHFCDDSQHNAEAQNKHNAKCDRKSTWKVIMESDDFKDNKTIPKDMDKLPTEFQIVKATGSRFVVVMDVSGSMKEFDRIDKLGESIRSWIKNDLPDGSKLGMIKFSSTAEIVSELQMISDTKSREEMLKKVPKDLGVATCIGCGLELAIQMLKENKDKKDVGGVIVLVTDGKNSPGYLDISDVKKDIIEAAIRVITIAFGEKADTHLENLADKTEGKSYFIKDEDSSGVIQDAFLTASTFQSSVKNNDLIFTLFEKLVEAKELKTNLADAFEVDPTVGRNLKLSVFNLDGEDSVESIELTGPDGNVTKNFEFASNTATITVALAQIGRWALNVNLKSPQTKSVLVKVTTQLRPDVVTPIKTECSIRNGAEIKDATNSRILIQAQIWKGSHPVTGSSVKAYVVKPNDEYDILELLDNGANADNTPDDGVYSRYYTNATQKGRYTVKCQVNSNHSSHEKLGFFGSASPQLFDSQIYEKGISEDNGIPMPEFSRITSGGSFKVEIPVSRNDSYPPGDVTDLSFRLINDTATNISIALKWTAPGDDLDSGTVSYYELKYSDVLDDVINSNFDDESSIRGSRSIITEDDLVTGSLQPKEAGIQQMATFQLTDIEREKPYYLALRAVDKAEKAGQVSNLVVFFIPDKSAFVLTRNTEEEISEVETDKEIHIRISNNEPSYHVSSVMVAAFGLILIVCLCVTLLMAIVKHTQSYSSYKGVPV